MSRVIEGRIGAWLPAHCSGQSLDVEPLPLINMLGYSSHEMSHAGWVRVGEARIEVTFAKQDDIVQSRVARLRKEQGELIAKSTALESKIQNLLAIGYIPDDGVPF